MKDFLLEIGTEEIPAVYMSASLVQLKDVFTAKLNELRLDFDNIVTYGTPRRLVVHITQLSEKQTDAERVVRGPNLKAAYDEAGNPTKALEGFIRGQGVSLDQIEKTETAQGSYIIAKKMDIGKTAVEVLSAELPTLILGLYFPKFMKWGEGNIRFVRPIRRIVALYGSDVIPFSIEGVTSGRTTVGHRFLAPDELTIDDPNNYFKKLENAWVMIDQAKRFEVIRKQVLETAEPIGDAVIEDDLLEENVYLVEYPTAFLGSFSPSFLELPEPVLVTAMKKHEKFFPIRDSNGHITPNFVAIRNGSKDNIDTVREGCEWVLASRFSDAKFFFDEDLKNDLNYFADRLDRIVFQEKLGTVKAKVERISAVMERISDFVNWDKQTRSMALSAARLAKADLSSGMVMELPALQGIVGAEYARRMNENEYVAEAIEQHYKPKTAVDSIPDNLLARAISIADRMDTLVGYLGLGFVPTGSSDPYALRRAAQGIVDILAEEDDFPYIYELAEWSYNAYQTQGVALEDYDNVKSNMEALFDIRLNYLLEREGVRYDIARASLGGDWPGSLKRTVARAQYLQEISQTEGWNAFVTSAIRPANIIFSAKNNKVEFDVDMDSIQVSLFDSPEEENLYNAIKSIRDDVENYKNNADFDAVYDYLSTLSEPIKCFFDNVMVMAEDPAKKKNRLTMMAVLNSLFMALGDFRQIVVEG